MKEWLIVILASYGAAALYRDVRDAWRRRTRFR